MLINLHKAFHNLSHIKYFSVRIVLIFRPFYENSGTL